MPRYRFLFVLSIAAMLCFPGSRVQAEGRERIRFDADWKFHPGDIENPGNAPQVVKWRWKIAVQPLDSTVKKLLIPGSKAQGSDWAEAAPGEDVFKQIPGIALCKTDLPNVPVGQRKVYFKGVDDDGTVYLNGQKLKTHQGWNDPFDVDLSGAWKDGGPNVLAVLVVNGAGPGGISETHVGEGASAVTIPKWSWRKLQEPDASKVDLKGLTEPTDGPGWGDATVDQDVFNQQKGFAWFRADLPMMPGPGRALFFNAVDDNATVYLNGKLLVHHEGWNESFSVPVDRAWKNGGPNHLAVLVENTAGGGGLKAIDLEYPGQEPAGPALAAYDDSSWRKVHLPHDFVVEGTFDPKADKSHGYLPTGVGWYRKSFTLPASDKGRALWIDFDGVYRNSRAWLNGKELGRHMSGYTSFRYDISGAAVYGGENVLVVRADASQNEGWWYEGGGIYRHVWLNKVESTHVAPWGVYVTAKPDQEVAPASAVVVVETTLVGKILPGVQLVSEVLDPSGKSVLTLTSDAGKAKAGVLSQQGRLDKPALWSLEKPNLYRLVSSLRLNGRVLDQVTTTFGVRSIRFDADQGFFLNGKGVKIQGTCNHQDFAGIGTALPDRIFTYRLEKLKNMGSNAYRCSHNPPATELLDECDRLGILVMDENRRLGDSEEVQGQVRDMLLRDRNHPSVILWSLCNEEALQSTPEGRRRGELLRGIVLKYDKTRFITAAMNGGYGDNCLTQALDVQGFNYHDWDYDPFHKSHPDMPLMGSETASTVSTRGIYENDKVRGYVSAYDVNVPEWAQTAEKAWKALADRPFMAGGFVWTGFDYRGEPTPYDWPCVNSHFGNLDMCGFPKDNYWSYQAAWGSKPVLHIFPHWNWPGKKGQPIDVWAYSNCDEVELSLNGKSLGKQVMPKDGHLSWEVPYEPGTLTAKGYSHGIPAAEDQVETTGKPASIRLKPYVQQFIADGEDSVPVAVEILDAKGRVVPTASNLVAFRVSGPAVVSGVGNGDPSCHEPDKASKRSAFNGLCLAVLQAGDQAGVVTLTATSPGLKAASVTLQTVQP